MVNSHKPKSERYGHRPIYAGVRRISLERTKYTNRITTKQDPRDADSPRRSPDANSSHANAFPDSHPLTINGCFCCAAISLAVKTCLCCCVTVMPNTFRLKSRCAPHLPQTSKAEAITSPVID